MSFKMPPLPLTQQQPALRFLTAGSVDDGKSTLIGRLFYDTLALKTDQLQRLKKNSSSPASIDFAKYTDGLKSEQAKNITIDVAHHYLTTPQRQYILLDAPGHEEYTRNMITAASSCDAVVILVDATKIKEHSTELLLLQTKRHAILSHLLRINSIVFAINKLDATPSSDKSYKHIKTLIDQFTSRAGIHVSAIIPISARFGLNITRPLEASQTEALQSRATALANVYNGPSLLEHLATLPITQSDAQLPFHFCVQYVNPADKSTLWGRIATGKISVGDELTLHSANKGNLPKTITVKALKANALNDAPLLAHAKAGQSIGLVITPSSLELTRGDWLTAFASNSSFTNDLSATLIWLDDTSLALDKTYLLKHESRWIFTKIMRISNQLDIHTLRTNIVSPKNMIEIKANSIVGAQLQLQTPLPLMPYAISKKLGAFILVDPQTQQTTAAGLIQA